MYVLYSLQTLKMHDEARDCYYDYEEITILGIFDNKDSIYNYLSTTYQTPPLRREIEESYERVRFNDKSFFIKTCTVNEGSTTMDDTEIYVRGH